MKKPYSKPSLQIHGSVEQITLGVKDVGATDGWTLASGEGLATVVS